MLRINNVSCCPRNHCSKNQINKRIISYKKNVVKNVKYQHIFNDESTLSNCYRVATLSKLYVIATGIIIQSLTSMGHF